MSGLPHRLAAWYGDDFTGSTDVLEVLASRGVDSVLFLEPPSEAMRARFAGHRAFGLAGSSRSRSPEWMDAHLPAAYALLAGFGAAVVHYKVCSTFDSSPGTGSIGRALEIGQNIFGTSCVPIVVGAPALGRYTAFGNLFAKSGGGIARIDRHPMSRHPVTPMLEADLRLHLAQQTQRRIGLVDFTGGEWPQGHDAVLIDVLDDRTLSHAGELLWSAARHGQRFVVGSSGVEYALTKHWGFEPVPSPAIAPVDRLMVLSGSCSPVTAEQVRTAGQAGFELIRLGEGSAEGAVRCLAQGRSVVIYTAMGPGDQVQGDAEFRERLTESGARTLERVLEESGVRRVVVAGGDTSSQAGAALGIEALTFVTRAAPGAPLCRAWSRVPGRDGMEVVFKGGQVGGASFFADVRG